MQCDYYGLFVKLEGKWHRLYPSESYTEETAKRKWWLLLVNVPTASLRKLPPVKQIDVRGPDAKFAPTPWR